jgi:hypothetical protein
MPGSAPVGSAPVGSALNSSMLSSAIDGLGGSTLCSALNGLDCSAIDGLGRCSAISFALVDSVLGSELHGLGSAPDDVDISTLSLALDALGASVLGSALDGIGGSVLSSALNCSTIGLLLSVMGASMLGSVLDSLAPHGSIIGSVLDGSELGSLLSRLGSSMLGAATDGSRAGSLPLTFAAPLLLASAVPPARMPPSTAVAANAIATVAAVAAVTQHQSTWRHLAASVPTLHSTHSATEFARHSCAACLPRLAAYAARCSCAAWCLFFPRPVASAAQLITHQAARRWHFYMYAQLHHCHGLNPLSGQEGLRPKLSLPSRQEGPRQDLAYLLSQLLPSLPTSQILSS